MSGIVGIAAAGEDARVERMLDRLAHRGRAGRIVLGHPAATAGVLWPRAQTDAYAEAPDSITVRDSAGPGRLAQVEAGPKGITLTRDQLGVAPLYYGRTADGKLAFASEVKAMLAVTRDVRELPPGCFHDGCRQERYSDPQLPAPIEDTPEAIAQELRRRLATAVQECIRISNGCEVGAWLSGGIDSSTMAALARPHQNRMATFAAGVAGAPDLEYARAAADFLHTEHHEVIVSLQEMLAALPAVIYHLESFDALLVRSSITNYLVAKVASQHVPAVLSGEGGDELFAGYAYLQTIVPQELPAELLDITGRLHNTALQRVDRSAAAHGLLAHVPFLTPEVLAYALSIPAECKLRDGVEKWILRRAVAGLLPDHVLNRRKAKFWEGAGVSEQLAAYAEERISSGDFHRERRLPNGWELNSKEELMYYRIFREHFGDLDELSWMGRTKGASRAA